MQVNASQSNQPGARVERQISHGVSFAKVLDGRKQPIRGLWVRNGRYYARLSVEDPNGLKDVKRVPLVNPEGNAVETVAQAVAELNRLRTRRADDELPKLGRTPTFADYADAYIAKNPKKASTIKKEKGIIKLWKQHLGGIRLDKIRPVHVAGLMNKRLASGMTKRTANLDIIVLRNVLKEARDVEELIAELPVPPGLNRKLKSVPPKRELFTPDDLDRLCAAAVAKKPDGSPVTKNGVQFCDYVKVMAYSGARRNEALALSWADVDFRQEKLTIERQAAENVKGNAQQLDATVKNSTPRIVDFNPALKKLLLEMRARRAPDSKWLFPSPQRGNKDIHAMSFRESMELARAHAKFPVVGFHDMRHLFISYCVMSGIDYMTIAKWVGHKDGGVLIGKVYGHLAESHTKEQAQRVNF